MPTDDSRQTTLADFINGVIQRGPSLAAKPGPPGPEALANTVRRVLEPKRIGRKLIDRIVNVGADLDQVDDPDTLKAIGDYLYNIAYDSEMPATTQAITIAVSRAAYSKWNELKK